MTSSTAIVSNSLLKLDRYLDKRFNLDTHTNPMASSAIVLKSLLELEYYLEQYFGLDTHPYPVLHIQDNDGVALRVVPLCLCHQHKFIIYFGFYVTKLEVLEQITERFPQTTVG